jgi:predicted nucleic acid-binding protein
MKPVKENIYFDICALGRPYDDQRHPRIEMETLAVLMISRLVKTRKYALFYAPIHEFELARNTDEAERTEIMKFLYSYGQNIGLKISNYKIIENRVNELLSFGIGLADSFHVASAEIVSASFITCDDMLIKKCNRHNVGIWVGTPIDFCKKEGLI